MFGRSDDDDSVTYFDTDMDLNDSKIYKGPGALDRAISDNFGGVNKWRMASDIFNKAAGGFKPYDEDKEYMKELLRRPFGGGAIPGSTQRLAGGLTMTLPRAFEPIITPGGGGYQGKSTGQRIAGVAGGALSGAAAGSAIPGIGTGIGAAIGALGGLFG